MGKILKNKPYFDSSGGGVTVSGGEPFLQPKFLTEFLSLCKKNNLHTAVDTSLHTTKKSINAALPYTDLFMISLKHFDEKTHEFLTGASNRVILENVKHLSGKKARIWFRYLILPGYTNTKENLGALADFLKTVNYELVELLPYHEMGVKKWETLKIPYALKKIKTPTPGDIEHVKSFLQKNSIPFLINE